MKLKRYHLLLAMAACALAGSFAFLPGIARSSSTTHLALLGFGYGDQIYNYDFEGTSISYDPSTGKYTNVDWPLDLLFWNNAFIDGVKNDLRSAYDTPGSAEHESMNNRYNSTGWVWDQDGGMKAGWAICVGSDNHYRIYAPPSMDAMYNPTWGFYVVGSTHKDHNEGCGFDSYDHSEAVEYDIYQKMNHVSPYDSASYDSIYFGNAQHDTQGNHTFDSDGYATSVFIAGGGGGGCARRNDSGRAPQPDMLVC